MMLKNYPPQDLHFEHDDLNEGNFPLKVYHYSNYVLLYYFYSGPTGNRLYKTIH